MRGWYDENYGSLQISNVGTIPHSALHSPSTVDICYVTNQATNSLYVSGLSLSLFVSETDASGNQRVEVVVGEILKMKVLFSLMLIMVVESSSLNEKLL